CTGFLQLTHSVERQSEIHAARGVARCPSGRSSPKIPRLVLEASPALEKGRRVDLDRFSQLLRTIGIVLPPAIVAIHQGTDTPGPKHHSDIRLPGYGILQQIIRRRIV